MDEVEKQDQETSRLHYRDSMDQFDLPDSELPELPDEETADSDYRMSSSSLHLSDAIDANKTQEEEDLSVNEREMRRHLNEMESSFLPDPASAGHVESRKGADDTYVNFGSPAPPAHRLMGMPSSATLRGHASAQDDYEDQEELATAQGQTDIRENEAREGAGRSSDLGTIESSPTAAAAMRNQSRNLCTIDPDTVPSRSSSASQRTASGSTVRRGVSPLPRDVSLPPSETPSTASISGSQSSGRLLKRPSYLYDRQTSQHSSYSSQSGMSDVSAGSEATISADYALQTGGSMSSNTPMAVRPNDNLSRFPSLGSVVSDMPREGDEGMPSFNRGLSGMSTLGSLRSDKALERLEEERGSSLSPPVTPRPNTAQLTGITDTAIAQHVQNIQVPDTIARDFRQNFPAFSPEKRPMTASNSTVSGRPQSNLTLKEQNTKIDRLTKENFDLKLKIHFLDQALQNRSDEGIKDMINKNVQFQTDLANERKENQSLRRKMREMEKKMREMEDELAESQERSNEAHLASHEDMEIEISELRQQLDHCQVRITKLSAENLAKELEKRKMAEYVAATSERKGNETNAAEEEAEMWKDLLTTESTRREQAEEDIHKLREELIVLRSEKSARERQASRQDRNSVSVSGESEYTNGRTGTASRSSVTLVEQLRHENIELRRDLGAQTSMLTSRNKERERLQQEIEDLKMMSRKGGRPRSLGGDSILDRSASRAHQRSASRASGQTGYTQMSDAEREEYEAREGTLRDQNASLRLEYQDLEKESQARMDYITQLEEDLKVVDNDLSAAVEDLRALQKERDEALQAYEDKDAEYEKLSDEYKRLEEEALLNIDGLEESLERAEADRKQLGSDLDDRNEDFAALQNEVRNLGDKLLQLEDDREGNLRRIEALEQELEDATQELDSLDKKLSEANQKNERLEIQSESLHGEISFLREEQEVDKIKIGDLENSLHAAQQSVADEKEKMQELEASLVEERRQRELVDNQSKQEVQKVLDDLNTENAQNKDEVRKLKRNLTSKETEALTYKQRLEELEGNLRKALGDLNGTRTSLLVDIEKMQSDLERTAAQLQETRSSLADKERMLRNRDVLLENSGLETRRLADLLEKERQSRKHDLHQFDLAQRGQTTTFRTVAQHESRVLELEGLRTQDKRRQNQLEAQYREQLLERNTLLLALWNRLSTLCGAEWTQSHGVVNGETTSMDTIARALPAFKNNLLEALKQIESLIGTFKSRVRTVEKSLIKDYQTLEHNLDTRIKRMDFLERAVLDTQAALDAQTADTTTLRPTPSRSSSSSSSSKLVKTNEEAARVKHENKMLKAELKFHRDHPSQAAQERMAHDAAVAATGRRTSVVAGIANSAGGGGKLNALTPRAIANSLLQRAHSNSTVEQIQQDTARSNSSVMTQSGVSGVAGQRTPIVIASPPIQPSEQRWVHRLKELERRLKAEREARLLDRRGARQRLEEGRAENEELKAMLEREKDRRESMVSGSGEGGYEGGAGSGGGYDKGGESAGGYFGTREPLAEPETFMDDGFGQGDRRNEVKIRVARQQGRREDSVD